MTDYREVILLDLRASSGEGARCEEPGGEPERRKNKRLGDYLLSADYPNPSVFYR